MFGESLLAGSGQQRLQLKGNNVLDLLYYEQSLCLSGALAHYRAACLWTTRSKASHKWSPVSHPARTSHQRLVAFVLLIGLCFSGNRSCRRFELEKNNPKKNLFFFPGLGVGLHLLAVLHSHNRNGDTKFAIKPIHRREQLEIRHLFWSEVLRSCPSSFNQLLVL